MSAPTKDEIREQVLIDGFPPNSRQLLDVENTASNVYKEFDAVASAVKLAFDAEDQFRTESLPSNATTSTGGLLTDWEKALGVAGSRTALTGTATQRQAQVTARLREFGASTLPNIKAALAAVMGGVPTILEHDRATFTTANTRLFTGLPGTIGALGNTDFNIAITDNAPASQAGVAIKLVITSSHLENLSFSLTGPDATSKSWVLPLGTGSAASGVFWLWGEEFADARITGLWTMTVANSNAATSTLESGSGIFVEGIGRDAMSGADGLGANIFEWAVKGDPTSFVYDADEVRRLVQRWNPAHCRGYFVQKNSGGGDAAIYDDPDTPFDGGTWS